MRLVVIPTLLSCIVAIGLFVLTGDVRVVYLAVLFPIVYLLFILLDIALLAERLNQALLLASYGETTNSLGKSPKAGSLAKREPFTALFKNILAKFRILEYRVNSLSWEAESSSKTINIPADDLVNEATSLALDRGTDEASFYRKILKFALANFRCQCGAIAIFQSDSADGAHTKIICEGIEGKRFETQLTNFLSPYFSENVSACFGLLDGYECRTGGADFTPFGARYVLCFPFAPSRSNSRTLGVLWLGYDAALPPSEREVNWVKELVSKIEGELQSYKKLYELSGKIKEAEHLDKAKTEFMLHISHDIRSPLNNIQSILNLLKLEGLQKDTPEMLDIALKNCDNVGEMVESILDYSKHRAGKLVARREPVDLRQIIRDIMDGFAVTARMKGLELRVRSEFDKCPVLADKRQVKRILTNIIGNGIKYTNRGQISVTIDSNQYESWVISVEDTGLGMSKEQLDRLFTPFTRFHGDGIEGIGLGLALSKILTRLNEGELHCQSKEGQGSKFELTFPIPTSTSFSMDKLPAVETLDVNEGFQEKFGPNDPLRAGKYKVLVVDDDLDFVDTLARGLELAGFLAIKSITVSDAISLFNFDNPEFVITDGSMPNGGGKRLLSFIQNSTRPVPVLVLSGHDIEKGEYSNLGASKVLSKPADIAEIAVWIRHVIENKESISLSKKSLVA